ncbi:MAG: Gmad2 immunoglobulin-like domain-containing protein [Actinomycetes bacterium]
MTTPINPFPDDDPIAAQLRDALHTEAAMVHTSDDALQKIRSGVDSAHRPWFRHPAAVAVAAAAVIGVAVGGLAVALGGDDDGNVVATDPTDEQTAAPSPSPTDSPTATDSPIPIEGTVYVYYVSDDGELGARLYREERPNIGAERVFSALTTMLNEPAVDPDYSSPWPDNTEVLAVDVDGDTATVDLSDFVSVGAEAELVAVQQLVYTVTANDKAVKRVQLLVDGDAPDSGHADWSQPVPRAPMLDVQGLVWLLSPTQDASVGSPVEISGFGTAFEGTVSWEVRRDGSDEVVAQGFTQAGSNGDFAEFSDTVELAAGSYELRAFESSAEDGRPLHVDSKTFTVR